MIGDCILAEIALVEQTSLEIYHHEMIILQLLQFVGLYF